jgi:flagellar L-ring protein precursor FlgH
LTVTLSERTSASNSTADNATRSASVAVAAPKVFGVPGKMAQDTNLQANASTKLDNKDGAKSDNLFTGTITVIVSEVMDNGNLRVSGEKQIGINDDVDTLRFSGIINPATIQPGNVVASSQVADARMETISRANVDPARVAGFLGRFFLSFIPFR